MIVTTTYRRFDVGSSDYSITNILPVATYVGHEVVHHGFPVRYLCVFFFDVIIYRFVHPTY